MAEKDSALLRIFEAVPTSVVIASPFTARILWVNKRLYEMYGAEDTEGIVGKTLFDFIEAPQLGRAIADLGRVALGESPPPVTYQLKRANGEHAAGQVSSVPIMFRGHPAMLSFVTDVSERELMVRSLKESDERYRLLLDSMPGGVVVIVGDSIAYANKALAHALGFASPAELAEKRFYRYIRADYRDAVRTARERMLVTGEPQPAASVVLLGKNGVEVSTTAASTVIHWDGRIATQTLMSAFEPVSGPEELAGEH